MMNIENYEFNDSTSAELKEFITDFRSAPKEVQDLVKTILRAPKEERSEVVERIMKSRNIEWPQAKEGMC